MDSAQPWPLAKLRRNFELCNDPDAHGAGAILLATGTFSPAHLGTVQMLWRAKERLEACGHAVYAAWISPSHDNRAKAERHRVGGEMPFSADFRVRMAELAVAADEFISVGTYETSTQLDGDRQLDYLQVAAELQKIVGAEIKSRMGQRHLRIYIVCGSDEEHNFRRLAPERDQGLVIVPRCPDYCFLEKPNRLLFVSQPAQGSCMALSSTRIREAFKAGDFAFATHMLGESAAGFVLAPSAEDCNKFRADFEILRPTEIAEGQWPGRKFTTRLAKMPMNRMLAVVVANGTMSPTHLGHVQMLKQAIQRLERAGMGVIAGWLSPSNDFTVEREAAALGTPELPGAPVLRSAFRQRIAKLSVCDDDMISAASLEATIEGRSPTPGEIARSLRDSLHEQFPLSLAGTTLKIFYVCGSDVARKSGLSKGLAAAQDLGVVIVPRSDDDMFMEVPHQMVYVADPVVGDAMTLSSTRLRAAIKAGETAFAAQAMAPAAARFTLAPTAAERQDMQADFEQLGVSMPELADLARAQDKLKGTLQAWIGPTDTIAVEDLSKLLRLLDPSWTNEELDVLLAGATGKGSGGGIAADDFVDWIFSCCQQAIA